MTSSPPETRDDEKKSSQHVNNSLPADLSLSWKMLDGERFVNTDCDYNETKLQIQNRQYPGRLYITNFRLHFEECQVTNSNDILNKPLTSNSIVSMSALANNTNGEGIGIEIGGAAVINNNQDNHHHQAMTTISNGIDTTSTQAATTTISNNENAPAGGAVAENNSTTTMVMSGELLIGPVNVPLGLIQRIERINAPNTTANAATSEQLVGVLISCKNGRRLKILKLGNDPTFEKNVYESLNRFAFPLSNNLNFFAFEYKSNKRQRSPVKIDDDDGGGGEGDCDGWNVYDIEREFKRMGLNGDLLNKWRITDLNKDYQFCNTYPKLFAVPAQTSDLQLRLIGDFRSKHRLPVLSWIYVNHNILDGSTNSNKKYPVIVRSAQPLCGMSGKRSLDDEHYLDTIASMCPKEILCVMDARPYLNALANCTYGGGFENKTYYTRCLFGFLNIENIHSMRDSLGATNDSKDFFSNLENSSWLDHIRTILLGAIKVIDALNDGFSVLVHCSDGWDRTAQLTSLAMLALDPYYRTIEGFEVLIEKEWLSFGHQFGVRLGHGTSKHLDQDRSPIFLQFIDCVWQMMHTNKNENMFEFNEKLLITILENMYTCQYGTFLYNSDFERENNKVKTETVSLWSFVNSNLDEYKNSNYLVYEKPLTISGVETKLWTSYYYLYKDTSDNIQMDNNNKLQKGVDSVTNLLETLAPNGLSFISNTGYRLFRHLKANLNK